MGVADRMGRHHQVSGGVELQVGPVIGLGSRHHECVSVGEGAHVQEGDTDIVGMYEAGTDVACDDTCEDACHRLIVGYSSG